MRSLRTRLTVVVVALVAAVLVALAVVLYVGVRSAAWQQHDDGLVTRARALSAIAEHDEGGYEMDLPPDPPDGPASFIEAWKPDGTVLARSQGLHVDLPRATGSRPVLADITLPDGRAGRAITLRFLPHEEVPDHPAGELTMVVAEGTESVDAAVRTVRSWFVVLGIAGLAAIALVTAWSLARGLRPLAHLAAQIEHIDDRRLATRLPLAGHPSELEVPVRKLNELLARLDASFARERDFTADVSHELRTPLAGLRTLLEVTALADRSTVEYRKAIADALDIVVQLGALVENLLTLARLDAGQEQIAASDVPLARLVDDCWRPHVALAAARSLELRNKVPPDAIAHTDGDMLRIIIGNLLSNAAEYTTAGGWIEVTTGDAVLDVTDSGPPIPAPQLDKIFDRLWRGDSARSSTGVHCGIGLSLARSLAASLSLSLTATSFDDGRVRFRIARLAAA